MDHFLRPGLRFEVVDSGPPDAPAVVLLHGFPQQPSTFEAVAARLNAEGPRTLTPTQRGYIRTARPTRRRDYRTAATAGDVIALLDTAGLAKAHIVGHDWGGNQAEALAARTPAKSLRDNGLPEEFANRYAAAMSEPGALTGALNWYRGIPLSRRPPLGRITVPTTCIWGRNDVVWLGLLSS